VKVLFLGANPSDETRLALAREVREITLLLRATPHGSKFEFIQEWAVRVGDLQGCLMRHKPDVVHLSGHGSAAGQVLVEDEGGHPLPVERDALGDLFRLLARNIRCVVLNACYSSAQADEIAHHIDCVVGMTTAVAPASAIASAGAF